MEEEEVEEKAGFEIDFSMTSPVDASLEAFCCRSVSFLRHWPVQHLSRHPQACMFHYFNRGQVLVRDSNNSDWIYIVKSGSLSVMKKLHHVNVTDDGLAETDGTCLRLSQNVMQKQKKRASVESPQVFRNSLEAARRLEQTLPGVFNVKDRLGVIDYDRIIGEYRSRIQPRGSTEPQSLILPEIPKHGAQCGSAPEALSETMAGQGQQLGKIDMAELEAEEGNGNGSAEQPEAAEMIRNRNAEPSYFGVDAALEERLKGVYLDSSDGTTTGSETNGQTSPKGSLAEQVFRMNIAYQRKFREHVGRKTMADQLDYKGARDFRYTEMDLNPMFVLVQVLEKGQYFGVSQLVSPEQPSLSLVSNGAELVVLSKKLFLDHCSDACMGYLRRTESPYPPEEKLQTNLQDYVNWEAHRTGLYSRQVSGLQEKQARRNQYVPRVPPGSYNFRSGEW